MLMNGQSCLIPLLFDLMENFKKIFQLSLDTLLIWSIVTLMSLDAGKPVLFFFDQVRHIPGCTATEDGKRFEISYFGSRGIVLSM